MPQTLDPWSQMSDIEGGSLYQRLTGRAAYLRNLGEVKTPELLEQAAAALTFPSRDQVYAEMSRLEPNWNGYGQSRTAAVDLALKATRSLLKL